MTSNLINSFVEEKAISSYGIKLFNAKDAIELTKLLCAENIKILGVDGIFLLREGTRPSMEDSILTGKLYDKFTNNEVEKIICNFLQEKENKEDLFFEVIF